MTAASNFRALALCVTAIAAVSGSLSGCSGSRHSASDRGAVSFNSEGVVSRWCLPATPGARDTEFSHGNEVLVNHGKDSARVVEVSLLEAEGIEVEDYWFAEDGSTPVGTLLGWPPKAGNDLLEPYPLEADDSVNLVVHLKAATMDPAGPPTATGLRVRYLQDGAEYVAETSVGVRLRTRC